MKKIACVVLVVISGVFVGSLLSAQNVVNYTQQDEPFELHRFTLENGMRVWCQPRPDSKSLLAFLIVRAGVRTEELSNNGISHFLEHMLFTGTERRNEDEIKEEISKRGGYWNGWTSTERTVYFAELSSQDTDIALDWLADIVFHSIFPEDKIDKERNVVFQEKWGKYGWMINTGKRILEPLGFGYNLSRTIESAIFPGSKLTLGYAIGEDEALDSIDREALLDYYQRYYVPNNATLLLVGNISPEDAIAKTQHYFGGLEKGTAPAIPTPPELPAEGPHHFVIRGPLPTNQCRIKMGARTVAPDHPDRWPLEVLADMLSTSLFQEIRNKRGLVYGVGAHTINYSDVGRFEISTRSEADKRELILQIIEEQLEEIRQGRIDPQKFMDARIALKGRWALRMENNFGRVHWLDDWVLSLTEDDTVPDYEAEIDAVMPEDLTRVLQRYFTPERSYVAMHLPILTVARCAWIAGGGLGLLVPGIVYYRRRRKRRRQRDASAVS